VISLVTGLLLGLLLGMRHALEPDHLAAVSTMIAARGNPRSGAVLGAFWGIGHTLALFAVGCVLAAVDARLPSSLADGFELLVAAMLVALGGRAIARAMSVRARGEPGGASAAAAAGAWALGGQPLAVGVVHGLAGSGALTALAIASLPTLGTRLLYIGLFGLGSLAGMASLTGIAGWPLSRIDRNGVAFRWLSAGTGAISVCLGVGWGWSSMHRLLHL
jgi:hypothetical protein